MFRSPDEQAVISIAEAARILGTDEAGVLWHVKHSKLPWKRQTRTFARIHVVALQAKVLADILGVPKEGEINEGILERKEATLDSQLGKPVLARLD